MSTTKSKYRCSQGELYALGDAIIASLTLYLALFAAFKAKYTAAFITALQTKLDDARNLPDAQARLSAAEAKRAELSDENQKLMRMFQLFKRYVVDVYPKNQQKAMLETAGSNYYDAAASGNWENTVLLGTSAKNFITANTSTLSNGGQNMPAAFPTDFDAQFVRFKNKYDEFVPLRQTGEGTEDKIEANNALYEDISAVCLDGQALFADDAGKREKFVINSVLEIITPPGAASLRVIITDAVTLLPIDGALVRIQAEGEPQIEQTSGPDGDVLFSSIPAATYRYLISKAGYNEAGGNKQVGTGTNARLELNLTSV